MGCSGRMGLQLCALLADDFFHEGNSLELADAICRNKKLTSIEGVSTRTIDEPPREPVHLWIDFSQPEGTVKLLEQIDTPVVIGTTGFTPAQTEAIDYYAKRHPVLLASNTSPGMNLLYRILEELAVPSWSNQTVLYEEHHGKKKDSPSGTAKELLKILEGRGIDDVQVHAVRGGSAPGIHSIRFLGELEELELTHRVADRKVFAQGALLAGLALLKKKTPGRYAMKDLAI